jgi:replication-associated recombination protein RarA
MACDHVIESKCSTGHPLAWKCQNGKPASCRRCEKEKKDKDKRMQEKFTRQQQRDRELQIHAEKIQKIDDQIRELRESTLDKQRSEELEQSFKQKLHDLETAKRMANRPPTPARDPNPVVEVHDQSVSSTTNTVSHDQPKSSGPESQPKAKPSTSEAEWDRQKRTENASNEAIDDLMKMTGLEEVKAQVLKIKARIDTALRQNTSMKDERYGIVLLGNPGTGKTSFLVVPSGHLPFAGKTTVARLYAKFLTSMDVLTGTEFVEISGSSLAHDGVAGAKKHIKAILKAGGGAFFLDEAYQLALGHNYGGAAVLDYLLAEIENQVGKILFILAGYNKQMEKFFEHNQGFDSRMPYRLQFADYTDSELLQILSRKIEQKYKGRMKVEGGLAGLYARITVRRLGRGRGREGFGNARAIENLRAKIAERQADRLQRERTAGTKSDDFLFKKEDLIGQEPSEAILESAAWKELQGMIGLQAVKDSMQSLLDRIHTNYQRELKEKELIEVSLNRVFLGSPGTGKTSVGKLYGQVLADMGLLSNGEGR